MATKKPKPVKRTLDARRDTMDFRDRMYVPTLAEVPTHIPLSDYKAYKVPVLDQGSEGACTGFGLATVANYLLLRRRVVPDPVPVSARMLYEMARRYDEWPGEGYSGSSARGAMKGWHKHGVCAEVEWPCHMKRGQRHGLTNERTSSARRRPLGAYFRVNHKDLVAMHAAIAEVGVLFATSVVHSGWDSVGADGIIQQGTPDGAHAFAIVAYDAEGFWLQNSWGTQWGQEGFARISYDDWLENGTDVWVARLGAPVTLRRVESTATAHAPTAVQSTAYAYEDLRPHIVSVGNNGRLRPGGDYGTSPDELRQIFEGDIPRVMGAWPKKRILLYAHGGLVGESAAVQRLAEYRPALLAAGVYPLAFVWRSDYWTTVTNILQDAVRRRRPEGVLDAAKDFMLDRLDDALEPLARSLTGRAAWSEMKENALAASRRDGAARLVMEHLVALKQQFADLEIHVIGHSAGSILHAPVVQLLTTQGKVATGAFAGEKGYGMKIATCTLWAPACTVDLFKQAYLPAIRAKTLQRFSLFTLSDKAERDDHCARVYNKSLLYLVSNAFEDQPRIPAFRDGVPILGMEKFFDADLKKLFSSGAADLVIAPNNEPKGSLKASQASAHGAFDDDEHTVQATFARMLGDAQPAKRSRKSVDGVALSDIGFKSSSSSLRDRRLGIDVKTRVS